MLNAHFRILVAAALIAAPILGLQAQPSVSPNNPAGYEVACSIQASSGFRDCDELPSARSCDAESNFASRASNESTDIAFVNRSDKPVKIYWLNFRGGRVLYDKYLPPGGRHAQQTFIGHNWLVTTLAEQCIGIFETEPQSIGGDVSATIPPPVIPDYEQPPQPEENLFWTPGYWAWSGDVSDYYWVPGTWVAPPIVGYLWTPGYWIVQRGMYAWHGGYWGPHIGFYGGINYGHGYFGRGFVAGSWRDGRMIYNQPVGNGASITRVSYNGGGGGIGAQPNAAELSAATDYHIAPTSAQAQQIRSARENSAMRAAFNNGHPSIAATSRPGEFSSATIPPAQHAGTLSFTHSISPQPAPRLNASAPGSASHATSSSPPPAHARTQSGASQPQAHVAQAPAEQQSAPQENQHPHQNSPQTRPRTVPHAEAHSP
jgi:VHL beta domain/WXXGXW repeat (2 copies)